MTWGNSGGHEGVGEAAAQQTVLPLNPNHPLTAMPKSAADTFVSDLPLKPASDFGPECAIGFYKNVPRMEYLRHPALSRSAVAAGARYSIAHAWHQWKSDPDDEMTTSQEFGNAFHLLTLEPFKFRERYDRAADRCQGTLASGEQCSYNPKERYEGEWFCGTHAPDGEPDDIKTLTANQFEACHEMSKSAEMHPESNMLLNGVPGLEEITMIWDNPETGLRCKARVDRIIDAAHRPEDEANPAMADLKTSSSAHREDFRRSIGKYGYWAQPPFYIMGYNTLAQEVSSIPVMSGDFFFVVVEKAEPYVCQVYSLDQRLRKQGTDAVLGVMSKLAEHDFEGSPTPERSYTKKIETIGMNKWQKERMIGTDTAEQPL